MLSFATSKWWFVPSLGLKKPKILWRKHFRESCAKNICKNFERSEKTVTTRKTLTEYTMRSCPTIYSNNCQL